MNSTRISVLLVESSPAVRERLFNAINAHPRLQVVHSVGTGEKALAYLAEAKADIVLMDIRLPGMDGFAATRTIMETVPLPIVICSSGGAAIDHANTFNSLEAGAVAFVEKPTDDESRATITKLLDTLVIMSEIKVVRRWPKKPDPEGAARLPQKRESPSPCNIICIGASTGGPPVLRTILHGLAKAKFPPVVIVQHISAGFLPGLVNWLQDATGASCRIGTNNEQLLPGVVYFAPDNFQLAVTRGNRAVLSAGPLVNNLRPSVSHLFHSVVMNCGASATGILLTGMGKDGAAELKGLRDAGGLTIAQNLESCVVKGMPGEAIQIGGATYVLTPDEIAPFLLTRF